jgi:ABC-2 type transport system permease protein
LTYTLIAEAFADPLNARTDLDTALWEGSIATRFLRPLGLFAQFVAETVGRWLFGFGVFSLPLLLLAPLLGVNPLPASIVHGLLFVPSLALAVSVGLALEFIFAAIIVRMESSVWAVNRMRAAVNTLLSGAIVPLPLLPWGSALSSAGCLSRRWHRLRSKSIRALEIQRFYCSHSLDGRLFYGRSRIGHGM